METEYKGAKIFYTLAGKRNPLVLLHGFMEDVHIWREIEKDLQKERQVICIDLPGHGKSEGFSDVHSMEEMANVVKKVLDDLGIEVVSIGGHSMGGYVSLEFYNNFPKMTKSLALINSTPSADSVEKQKNRERSAELVGKNKEAFISMALSNLFSKKSKTLFCPEIEELKNRALQMKPKNIQAALRGMKIRTNYEPLLKQASIQKIIIGAQQDPIMDFNELRSLAAKCGASFFEVENGHNSYIEDAFELRKIMHFID